MNVYLEDHPPVRQQYINPRRAKLSGAIVVHTAECQADFKGLDTAAEDVAAFIASRKTAGSYHSTIDSDSICRVGRYEWEMFHEGTGGNPYSLGLSFACEAKAWRELPPEWVSKTIHNGAIEAANMEAYTISTVGIVIPAKRITVEEYRARKPGFISHAELDPKRRSDPGSEFPWDTFLEDYEVQTMVVDDRFLTLEARFEVDRAYRAYLGRTPSDEELIYWTGITKDRGVEFMKKAIMDSDEARGRK